MYVFVVPYCTEELPSTFLKSFLLFSPAVVKCFSVSSKFILLAVIPLLLLLYNVAHISFNKYTPLLYPSAPLKYTSLLVGVALTKSIVPAFSFIFSILHCNVSLLCSIVWLLLYPL